MKNKKGFTLAELLIVVAIIAVLVGVSIPVFTSQLNKAKQATELANVRAAYAETVATALAEGSTSITVYVDPDLTSALKYTGTGGTTITNDATNHTITVSYGGVSDSFSYDSDVKVEDKKTK